MNNDEFSLKKRKEQTTVAIFMTSSRPVLLPGRHVTSHAFFFFFWRFIAVDKQRIGFRHLQGWSVEL